MSCEARTVKVAILHSPLGVGDYASLPGDADVAMDDTDLVEPVAQACRKNGHEPTIIPVDDDPSATLLSVRDADVVFNLVETIHRDTRYTAAVAWLLDWAGIPFTGATPEALTLGLDKPQTKAVLAASGIRVPSGCVLFAPDDPLGDVAYPVIVKPSREDASSGIDAGSVLHDEAALRERARLIMDVFRQPVLVEEFIPGREIMTSVIGGANSLTVLPMQSIDFSGYPEGTPHILTFTAKWRPDSAEARGARLHFDSDLPPSVTARVEQIVLAAWRLLGFRHYGRIDVRLDADLEPCIIEANPNPDLVPTECLAQSALKAGISYDELIGTIIDLAVTDGVCRGR